MTYFADNALIDLGLCFIFRIGPHKRVSIQDFVSSLGDLRGLNPPRKPDSFRLADYTSIGA